MKAQFDGEGFALVVTGGANGIGRAVAEAALATGARVAVLDRDADALGALSRDCPGIMALDCDVADREAVMAAMARVEEAFGAIDGLVCGAAIQPRTRIDAMPAEEWRRVLSINLDGVVWCCQAVFPGMARRRRGSVIVFTSGLAGQGWPEASAYAASKAALVAFAKSAAKEMAASRVRVNIVSPGVIDTPQYRAANAGADHDSWRATLGVGLPEDVVRPLLFLLSDAATMSGSFLTRDMAWPAEDPEEAGA